MVSSVYSLATLMLAGRAFAAPVSSDVHSVAAVSSTDELIDVVQDQTCPGR